MVNGFRRGWDSKGCHNNPFHNGIPGIQKKNGAPNPAIYHLIFQETLSKNLFQRALDFLQPCLNLSQLRTRLVARYGTMEVG